MKYQMSRRAMLSGAASALATASFADAPLVSLRPVARAGKAAPEPIPATRPQARPDTADLIAAANLGGTVGFVVADADTGDVLENIDGDVPLPPASVTKSVTALYALDALGPDHRFETQILADGPIVDGVLQGNLILAGGGDPQLLTDDLADLAQAVKDTGLREVKGDFLIWGEALARVDEIDPQQLDHLGYNPAIAGLNLNFNRVHFEWKSQGADYTVTMDARSANHRPAVTVSQMQIVDRRTPVYAYADGGGMDRWSVARRALNSFGSRWLPVRYPALYAGEVFAVFARAQGIVLDKPKLIKDLPAADVVASFKGEPLREVLRDMLRFSTNLTAEVAGMAATAARAGQNRGLRTSALGMTRWAEMRAGIHPAFVDHSGLGDASRISAQDMVRLMTARGVVPQLQPILKAIALTDPKGNRLGVNAEVRAKTGTLNFVSALAGYLVTPNGRRLAFAFFAADVEARARGKLTADEQPAGAASYNTRAKRLQQTLLQRWARVGDI